MVLVLPAMLGSATATSITPIGRHWRIDTHERRAQPYAVWHRAKTSGKGYRWLLWHFFSSYRAAMGYVEAHAKPGEI